MIIYLSIIFFLSFFAFIEISFPKIDFKILFIFSLLVLLIFTSIKYNIGPDYDSYFRYFYWSFEERATTNQYELGYQLINNFVILLLNNNFENVDISWFRGENIPGITNDFLDIEHTDIVKIAKYFAIVNFICSSIVFFALYLFLKEFNYKFIALLLLFTLFIVIYFMGYVRQGIAASIVFLALSYLIKEKYLVFLFIIILASLFHITSLYALSIFIIYLIINKKIKYLFFILSLLVISCIYILLFYPNITERVTSLINWYAVVNTNVFISNGVYFRMLSFSWVIILFFFNFNYFIKSRESNLIISLTFSFIFLFLFLLFSLFALMNITTIIDRLTAYLIPLQLFIVDRLIHKNIDNFVNKNLIMFSCFMFYISYFSIWLVFGNNSHAFLNYSTIFNL